MSLVELADDVRMTPEHYLAVRSDGLTFMACAMEAIGCMELVRQVDRLYGTNLMRRGSPIDIMVDDATGRSDADKQTFLRFVWNCIFIRVEPIKAKSPKEAGEQ